MIHHGDQQVYQHDDVYDGVGPEHEHAPEPGENLDALEFEALEVDQAENRPEEGLYGLEEAGSLNRLRTLGCYSVVKLCAILCTWVSYFANLRHSMHAFVSGKVPF